MSPVKLIATLFLSSILSVSFSSPFAMASGMDESFGQRHGDVGRFAIILSKHVTDVSAYSAVSKLSEMGTPATSLPTKDKTYKRIVFALAVGDRDAMRQLSGFIGGEVVFLSEKAARVIASRMTTDAMVKTLNKSIKSSKSITAKKVSASSSKKSAASHHVVRDSPKTVRAQKIMKNDNGLFLVKSATDGLFKMDRSKPHRVVVKKDRQWCSSKSSITVGF